MSLGGILHSSFGARSDDRRRIREAAGPSTPWSTTKGPSLSGGSLCLRFRPCATDDSDVLVHCAARNGEVSLDDLGPLATAVRRVSVARRLVVNSSLLAVCIACPSMAFGVTLLAFGVPISLAGCVLLPSLCRHFCWYLGPSSNFQGSNLPSPP